MPTEYNKAWVALILAILTLLELHFGIAVSFLSENVILSVLAIASPILVWLVPNRSRTILQRAAP